MKAVIIGSGNLATHLSLALHGAGVEIVQVWSRTLAHAQELAERLGCEAIDSLTALCTDAQAYIIAVKDDAIARLAGQIGALHLQGVVMHTAGSVGMDALSGAAEHYGVLYPMQSFSKTRAVDFRKVPCFVEANGDHAMATIQALAEMVSDSVQHCDSKRRERLHLAAVFANNLTNHCYRLAERILQEQDLDFSLLLPLIEETAAKVKTMSPKDAQTGPMKRYDRNVMSKHVAMLPDERTQRLYRLMAQSIHSDYSE
ncbi:MAG: DUF2520 domain-containing protein [Bacteroidales bacterium]|nr:DUF2520 domain-containing protein [Bacteroidales bacterium]